MHLIYYTAFGKALTKRVLYIQDRFLYNKIEVKENEVRTVPIAKISAKGQVTIPAERQPPLLSLRGMRLSSKSVARKALEWYVEKNVDWTDAFVAAGMEAGNLRKGNSTSCRLVSSNLLSWAKTAMGSTRIQQLYCRRG
ncbi:MAG: hypothetical protein AB2448_13240 [Moorella sp. (in: firmicutes)]